LPTQRPATIPTRVQSVPFSAAYNTKSGCAHDRRRARTR